MNRPCRIHFHDDSAPSVEQLPERYRNNVEKSAHQGVQRYALLVQNAFPIDFAPNIIRTRVGGTKEEDPVDFPLESISHIEWFYGSEVPAPLSPWTPREQPRSERGN
jgi:hypothetical protein